MKFNKTLLIALLTVSFFGLYACSDGKKASGLDPSLVCTGDDCDIDDPIDIPEPPCADGEVLNEAGECVAEQPVCEDGEVLNDAGECVAVTPVCDEGEILGEDGVCVVATKPILKCYDFRKDSMVLPVTKTSVTTGILADRMRSTRADFITAIGGSPVVTGPSKFTDPVPPISCKNSKVGSFLRADSAFVNKMTYDKKGAELFLNTNSIEGAFGDYDMEIVKAPLCVMDEDLTKLEYSCFIVDEPFEIPPHITPPTTGGGDDDDEDRDDDDSGDDSGSTATGGHTGGVMTIPGLRTSKDVNDIFGGSSGISGIRIPGADDLSVFRAVPRTSDTAECLAKITDLKNKSASIRSLGDRWNCVPNTDSGVKHFFRFFATTVVPKSICHVNAHAKMSG